MVEPSRTSQAVALIRAGLTRPHTPDGDPDAQRRLTDGFRHRRRARRWWPTCRPGRRSSTTRCCPPSLPG